jgi:hypothetical protein
MVGSVIPVRRQCRRFQPCVPCTWWFKWSEATVWRMRPPRVGGRPTPSCDIATVSATAKVTHTQPKLTIEIYYHVHRLAKPPIDLHEMPKVNREDGCGASKTDA